MNIEKIEQIIKLVKENDVKKFKYKNFEDEIEIDFMTRIIWLHTVINQIKV